ncbi:MAG: tetratricopeptide repeat protein [Bryobacteraceae bacterium]|jgi:tetratricopeptide (TPR) repeat protein
MQRIEKTVFLSYRRTYFPWALNIFQNLTHHGYDVFFDYTGLGSGDFEPVILENITARAHFLVLLTPSALENCDDPADWLRREIETALTNRRNIVPLMLDGFEFGSPRIANQLTGALAALKHYNGLSIPPEYFMEAMKKLRNKFLRVPLDSVSHPASPLARRAAVEQQIAAAAAPAFREAELTAQQWAERGLAALDIDERHRFYTEAIRLKPDYASAFYSRGNARRAKGDLEGALQDYAEAIRFNPDYAEAFNNRGNTRRAKGDLEGALQDYSEAIRLRSDDVAALTNRGAARHATGNLEGALEDYAEAIRLDPNYPAAIYNRGNARLAKGDLELARRDHSEAIRLGYKPN